MAAELADNLFIVFLAYVAAFLPWTVVSGTDFVNSTWRPVNVIRRDAINNFLLAVIPAGYIIFYITLQAISEDYKEMFAAAVALLFSLLHAARTCAALLQLHFFRSWALDSIRYLRAVGIHYRPTFQHTYDPLTTTDVQIVDHLLINDTIIDNELAHGPFRLFLKYSFLVFRLPPSPNQRGFYCDRVILLGRILLLPLVFLTDVLRHWLKHRPMPELQVIPHNPIDIWINWSIAFAAQGLQHWFQTLAVPEDPDRNYRLKNQSPLQKYHSRRDYFAGQVLSSAALHFWPRLLPTAENVPTPMLWSVWPVSSGVANAVPSKQDFLLYAMSNPHIYPFRCTSLRETGPATPQNQPSDFRGYLSLGRKMERVSDGLPPEFGDVDRFDPFVLEWFAVLLHLGLLISDTKRLFPSKLSPFPLRRSASADDLNHAVEHDGVDIAFENMAAQLGFSCTKNEKMCRITPNDIFDNAALAFASQTFTVVAEKSVIAWRVSEFIDTWLALIAGNQLSMTCEGGCDLCNTDIAMSKRIRSAHAEEGKAHVCNVDVRSKAGQKDLETRRLERQYGCKSQPYWHMEQTLTFMGFSMEYVRSRLANWVKRVGKEAAKPETWRPQLRFSDAHNVSVTSCISLGTLSEELAMALHASGKSLLFRRCVHVRLLWEVMEILKERCAAHDNPSRLETITMCILSFPSLAVEILSMDDESLMPTQSSEDDNLSKVYVEKAAVQHFGILVEPRGAPQPFFLKLKLKLGGEQHGLIQSSVVRRADSDERDNFFDWHLWRDAFIARLEALQEWQINHDIPSVPVRDTRNALTEGMLTSLRYFLGNRESFDIWLGWQPFREKMCSFELENRGFFFKFNHTSDVTTAMRRSGGKDIVKCEVESTEVIPRSQLTKSCVMVMEMLAEYDTGPVFNAPMGSTDYIIDATISHARSLMARSPDNMNRAILLLESGAVGLGSAETVIASVQLLTDSRYNLVDVRRAIRFIDDHLNLFSLAIDNDRIENVGTVMKQLHSLYEQNLLSSGYSRSAIRLFCRFAGWMIWIGPNENVQLAVSTLRRVFLLTRQYDALFMLAIAKEVESLHSDDSNRSFSKAEAGALWLEYLQRASSEGGITSANDSLSWFELQSF